MEIVPTSITNFERSDRQLQAFWLFSMFVAGKNSDFASNKLHAIMELMPEDALPIDWICKQNVDSLLRQVKVGQYGRLTKAILGSRDIDLRNATLETLMGVHGVGPKTARFFIVHSRKDCKHAVLDTHVLHFLRDNGYPQAPKTTPSGRTYLAWEKVFLDFCNTHYYKTPIAIIDLDIWTRYSAAQR